jgi:hypothetical protein
VRAGADIAPARTAFPERPVTAVCRAVTDRGEGDNIIAVEQFFAALLVLVCVLIVWFSVYVVYSLFADHR